MYRPVCVHTYLEMVGRAESLRELFAAKKSVIEQMSLLPSELGAGRVVSLLLDTLITSSL